MSQMISLKEAERKVFRTTFNDGLVDIFLGCFFLMMVIGPYLSEYLGDFWASAVFLPFWGLVYLTLRYIRKQVVAPRTGVVKFGQVRIAKLKKFTYIMLVVNILVLILGLVVAANYMKVPGQITSVMFGMILLIGFTTAAYLLDFNRLYFYGLLVGIGPLVGEWLWSHGYVTHHGFPITFGISSATMILTGLAVFARFLRDNPLYLDGIPSEEARDD